MARTASLVCPVSTIIGYHKNPLEEQALIAGAKQNLRNLFLLDIYGPQGPLVYF
jgi:hypothetical protein